MNNLLELKNISLCYGDLKAIKNVNLSILPGETRALIGEHGAGKTTIAKIIAGFLQPNQGNILINDLIVENYNNKKARSNKIDIITQDIELFPNQSIAFNIFNYNKEVFSSLFYSKRKIENKAKLYLKEIGCDISYKKEIKELNFSEKTMISVLKHLYSKPKLIIIDEAIEKLSAKDLIVVTKLLNDLIANGSSVLYITHRIDDIYTFANSVSIVRNGSIILTEKIENIDKINLIKLAYTQVIKSDNSGIRTNPEFYQLLKYNQAILEFLPLSVLVIDQKEEIKLMNKMAGEFFHQQGKDMYNTHILSFLSQFEFDAHEQMCSVLQNRAQEVITNQNLIINNNKINCNIIIYPIMDGNYFIGSIIVIVDITKYEKLREKVAFSEKLCSIGILAAGVAHEINNPLEVIGNYMDYLQNIENDDVKKKYLTYIDEEIDTINEIVGNLITFSEEKKYNNELFNLSDYAKMIIKLTNTSGEKTNIEIESLIENDINIIANKIRIKQVMTNIIKNAFEAMQTGGKLTIKLYKDNDQAIFLFIDTGEGLLTKNSHDEFLPFYTTKYSTGNNMGLGMSIIYKIVKNYNGSLKLENRKDKRGCIVTVKLPLNQDS